MHIIVLQINEEKNEKRIRKGLSTLLYQPYDPDTFNIRNYDIIHMYFKFKDIEEKFFESILSRIEKDFTSFYTSATRPENGIVTGDLVKIGRRMYYYNGKEQGWKYIGMDKPRRW